MKLFKNGISLKWILLVIGIVAVSGMAIATNPIISDQTSIFNGVNATAINTTTQKTTSSGDTFQYINTNGNAGVNSATTQYQRNNIAKWNIGLGASDGSDNFQIYNFGVSGITFQQDDATGKTYFPKVFSNTGESACWVAATKELVRNAGVSNTCAPSAEKYKNIKGNFNDSTVPNNFIQLQPIVFSYKSAPNQLEKFGFSANRVAVLYPQVVTTHYEGNGTFLKLILNQSDPTKADSIQYSDGVIAPIEGINYEMFSAILVNQVQDQQFQLDVLSSQVRKICTNSPSLCS